MVKKNRLPWNENPFLRILPVFIAGIILAEAYQIPKQILIITGVFSTSLIIVMSFGSSWFSWKLNYLRGIAIQVLILLLGPAIYYIHNYTEPKNHITDSVQHQDGIYRYILQEPAITKTKSFKSIATVDVLDSGNWLRTGKAIIYFSTEFNVDSLRYGCTVVSGTAPGQVSSILNPGAFDYRKYLAGKGIFFQVYLKKDKAKLLAENNGSPVYQFIFMVRDYLLKVLRTNIGHPDASGLAEALLTGYRNDVDDNLLEAYVNTGVVHVIAISGLHLGLIYLILAKFSGMLLRGKSRHYLQPVFVISALWIFTLISGASPSVVRSAVMFSLFAIGNLLERKSNPLNTLAASAFLLLAFQPIWLFDIGFQLSYTAVGGILLLHKKLCNFYTFTNPLSFKIWEAICLTLAAQLLTTPLLLFYFHRFPLLFLFTNLVAVPLSSIILFAELLLCAVSFFPMIALTVGNITESLIGFMNQYVIAMDRVPGTNLENIFFSQTQTLLLYAILITFCFVSREKIKQASMLMLMLFACILLDNLRQKKMVADQSVFAVLQTPGKTNIAFIEKENLTVITDSNDQQKNNSWLTPLMYHFRIVNVKYQYLARDNTYIIRFGNFSVLRLTGKPAEISYTNQAQPDVVVVSGNCLPLPDDLVLKTRCKHFVADATNSVWKIRQWKKDAEQLHLRFHSVPEQGAFLLSGNQLITPD